MFVVVLNHYFWVIGHTDVDNKNDYPVKFLFQVFCFFFILQVLFDY